MNPNPNPNPNLNIYIYIYTYTYIYIHIYIYMQSVELNSLIRTGIKLGPGQGPLCVQRLRIHTMLTLLKIYFLLDHCWTTRYRL